MKAISEFKYSVQNPTGDEYFIVNQDLGNGNYKSYKVTLDQLKDYIQENGSRDMDVQSIQPNER